MRRNFLVLLGIFLAFSSSFSQIPVTVTSSAPEESHKAVNLFGILENLDRWAKELELQLRKIELFIENLSVVKGIRAYNEVMTTIQDSISETLGTVESIFSAPMEIFDSLVSIPSSFLGILENGYSEFRDLYWNIVSIMDVFSEMQSFGKLKDFNDLFKSSGGAFGFASQVRGLRTKASSAWLGDAKRRARELENLSKENYGGDVAQILSTTNDLISELVKQNMHIIDNQAMSVLQESADAALFDEAMRARAGAASSMVIQNIRNQIQ